MKRGDCSRMNVFKFTDGKEKNIAKNIVSIALLTQMIRFELREAEPL